MSIAITLGVTTPETSYSDMAAGSDPESVEASPAVNEKNYNNHTCGSAKDHGYRGLPYTDHNYGAPPPPTPPASPLSQTIIPRMDINGAVRSSCYHRDPVEHSADSDSSSEEDGAKSGWCRCSPTPDASDISCRCRELDRRKGEDIQHRKPENISAGESSATESGDEEVSPSTISYTATQHTPTSIKLTVNRVKSRKSKKRKKSTEKTRGAPKVKKVKAFREGSRKSLRMKGSNSEAVGPDETLSEGLESRILHWTDQYQEAGTNQYSCDLQTSLRLHHSADTISCSQLDLNNTVLGSQMQFQLGRVTRVQKHRKILRAAQNLDPDTLIIEYRGKVMLKQQFEVNGHLFKKPCPFVLFYSKCNDVEVCVDARTFGNDARFIRRSCTPNAEVRHMIAEGQIHLCIYAIRHIAKDSEVTIEFDYDFNSCKYKVDCACHKGNHSCPVQKYNLSPTPQALSSTPVGAETRRRKAQRKELESNLVSSTCDPQQDSKDLLGASDPEERTQDGLKEEEHGLISSKMEDPPLENPLSTPITAPPKPVRPPKPRSKSRISRYRSNSSQRARRQRQALAHQASAAAALAASQTSTDQGSAQNDEASQGPYGSEPGHGEPGLGVGSHHVDGDNQGPNSFHRGSVRYPKTKKYLVTEWLNDKVPGGEKVPLEVPVERPLRITTDTTVLATTLNMLPGHSHSSLICTAPRHYIRFGSPFNPERRRPRPLQMDGTYGCYKKRWIKQMEDESCSTSLEDGTESTSSQQSTSSRSTPNPLCNETSAPLKKRHYKCMTEIRPVPPDHLLRPLSPISPPLPEDSLNPLLNTPHGSLLSNGLAYSPRPLLCTSRCNTPLQFENISSPEASPVHRPESISPEPALQAEFDASRPSFLDLSLPSSLESPVALTSDDFCIHGVASGQDSQGQLPVSSCPSSDSQRGEQAFKTEFNLIYTCSPLNANLGNPVSSDRRPPQADGVCSPSDSLHSSMSVQGPGSGSMSPYGDPYYGVGYTDSSTSPHTSNPPQRKKVSLLEYRKRKQGGVCDSQPTSSLRSRPGSYYSRESHSSQQPPASPQTTSSSALRTCIPQREELSPPDNHGVSVKTSNQWMVPTTVERLREGRVLERVLRSIKMEQTYRNSVECAEESDANQHGVPVGSMTSSPIYTLQSTESRTQTQAHTQTRSPSFTHQTSNSPFQSSYSPSSGPGLFPRLSSYSSPPPAFSSDSWQPAASQHQQTGSSSAGAPGQRTQRQTKTDLGSPASRDGQQQVTLSSRIQCGPGPAHYPQQGSSLGQFQHTPLQGPGVQTQSGSF